MEILSQETIQITDFSNGTIGVILICCVLAIITFVIYLNHLILGPYEKETKSFIIIRIASLISCIAFTAAAIGLAVEGETIQKEYQEYKVIFNENIDMDEFSKKYEIVSKEGKLYTIKDIESIPVQR